jgi:diguanylate cyclase (GGDEF)-like protein
VSRSSAAQSFVVLRELASLAAKGLPLDELLGRVLESTSTVLEADAAVILLEQPPLRVVRGATRAEAERLCARSGDPERTQAGHESVVVAPVLSQGLRIGHVAVLARRRGAFSAEHEEVLAFLAKSLVGDLEAVRLYRLATIDPGTRAGSRQLLFERLPDEIRRSQRAGGRPLAIVRFGVEDYPRLLSAQGQKASVQALAEIVRRVHGSLRAIDWIARLYDDAFVCVLPGAGDDGAERVASRMSERVEKEPIELGAFSQVQLRIECANTTLQQGMDAIALLKAAESAWGRR